jgi:hypothetical protein
VALPDFFRPESGAFPGPAPGDSPASEYLVELKSYLPQLSPQQREDLLEMVKGLAQTLRH